MFVHASFTPQQRAQSRSKTNIFVHNVRFPFLRLSDVKLYNASRCTNIGQLNTVLCQIRDCLDRAKPHIH